ncbi:MAG: 1-deoxy-D-xylulose-5-phosphate synthase [Comamonadaceae bacterium]|nr:1-deoxy-D-xylulose-5-phosphate synthase [Comamonadaceae bacterium]
MMRRVMYIENKSGGLSGQGRIGWVRFSRTGRTMYYADLKLQKTKSGYKYNCLDEHTGDPYWVSGPRKDGLDTLYGGMVQIDEDARPTYWLDIRRQPRRLHEKQYRG